VGYNISIIGIQVCIRKVLHIDKDVNKLTKKNDFDAAVKTVLEAFEIEVVD
jgi:hypothetical protein